MSIAALWLVSVHLAVLGAGMLSPYDPAEQDRQIPLAPPTRIHIFDEHGRLRRPFVCLWTPDPVRTEIYTENCASRFPIHLFPGGHPYRFGPMRFTLHLFGTPAPSSIHLMGTDEYGRDQFSRFLYGGRVSLATGLLACAVSLLIGVALGFIAGFYGGWIDGATAALAEMFLALPWLYALFAVRAFLPLDTGPFTALTTVAILIGCIGWARPARVFRGIVFSAKERDYVRASRGFGASDIFIMRRHVFPQVRRTILTQSAILLPQYVLAEVTLSFFGLGVSEPTSSWGNMLSPLQHYSVLVSCWWMYVPVALLIPIILAYWTLAERLPIDRCPY